MENKPTVVVSKCIEHGHCRYDGSQISSSFVKKLEDYVDFITVCPEMEIGLPSPREAVRIIDIDGKHHLVYSMTGTEVTKEMEAFSSSFLEELQHTSIQGFILKSRSPSCGVKEVKVYKKTGKTPAISKDASGYFGKAVVDKFEGLAIEDEGRLKNFNIREHFLTQIYTLKRFEQVKKKQTMKSLIDFHSDHKYLLMAYHQGNQKLLGKIVANHEGEKIATVIEAYEHLLKKSLAKPLRRGTNINMLMHLFGYFKKDLRQDEKAYFLEILEQYSTKKIPFHVPIAIIYGWVIHYEEAYLKRQTIFEPYPKGILDISDSGKGID